MLPLREIEEDVLKVTNILLDNQTSLPDKVLKAKELDFEKFHLYRRLVNASQTVKDIRLPGLPSVAEISEIKPPELDINLEDIFHTNNIKYLRQTLDKMSMTEEELNLLKQPKSALLTDDILSESLDDVGNKTNAKRTIIDGIEEKGEEAEEEEEEEEEKEFPLILPELVGVEEISKILEDPGPLLPDVENLVTVTKIIPRLIPFVIADYKDQVAGWLEGTVVKDTELAEVHQTLVTWHAHLEGMKGSAVVPREVLRVAAIVEENNIGLLTLILHLMVRAGETDGSVTLTK